MAFLTLNRNKLQSNYTYLNKLFADAGIAWAIVTKVLCGDKRYLEAIAELGIEEVCDSRVSNLKLIKQIQPSIQTVYIKPPARRSIPSIVRYADASFNSEIQTIRWLSEEAVRQGKLHKVIIMIELGDLREGVLGDDLIAFYEAVFQLPGIQVTAIGANLNCLHGVMPSQDKLIQLSLYKQLIELKYQREIPWVTGGTSVVIPLLLTHQVPRGINHFRVGESLFFGNDLVHGTPLEGMWQDIFTLYAEIIEMQEKPVVPSGVLEANPSGETYTIQPEDYGRTIYRAIIDIGLLDVSPDFLLPEDERIRVMGASSDMLVLELGEDNLGYQVGDLLSFRLRYMGLLGIMNSRYVEKKLV